MNMNKALQNLYHAVSGETTQKVNISKLLVDIHHAITGKESANKNNWSKIIDSMATNWPEGGGNPNEVQIVTGTATNPWGEVDKVTLAQAITSGNATAMMEMTIGEQAGVANLIPGDGVVSADAVASVWRSDSLDGFVWVCANWSLINNNILALFMVQGDSSSHSVTDLKSMASMITTKLTITWHPLPN